MKLKTLTEKEIKKAKINKKMAIEKGILANENYDLYLKIQALYKKTFDYYVETLIPINKEIDKALEDSKLDYGKIQEKQKNVYHKFSYLNSDYIFIRNFFYIERLEKQQLESFIKKIENNDFTIDDEILEIVKDTFKDVIKALNRSNSETFKVCYGVSVPINFFDNDALVLFINYWKNTKKLEGQEFIDNKIKKEEYLQNLVEKLEKEMQSKLNCKARIRYWKGILI